MSYTRKAVLAVVLTVLSTPAYAANFEIVVETEMPMRQFLSDGLGYGFGGDLGVAGRFENDAVETLNLENNREGGDFLNFVDRDNGLVFSVNVFVSNQTLNVFQTTDAGATWTSLGSFVGYGAPTVRWYSPDAAYVIAAGQDDSTTLVVFQTTDRFQSSAEVTWASPNGGGDKIDFVRRVIPVSADVMYAPDGGGMLYTNDGAQTWMTSPSLTGLGSNDVLVGTPNVVIRQYNSNTNFSTWVSGDGGQTFLEATTPMDRTSITAVDFLDDQHGLAVVRIGANQNEFGVLRTADGGVTWTEDTLPAEMQGSPILPHYVTADVQYVATERELMRVGTPTGMPSNNTPGNNQTNNGTTSTNNGSSTNPTSNSSTGNTNGSVDTNTEPDGNGGEGDGGCSIAGGKRRNPMMLLIGLGAAVMGVRRKRRRRRGIRG